MTRISILSMKGLSMAGAIAIATTVAAGSAMAAGPNPSQAYQLEGRDAWASTSIVPPSRTAVLEPYGMGLRPADNTPGAAPAGYDESHRAAVMVPEGMGLRPANPAPSSNS